MTRLQQIEKFNDMVIALLIFAKARGIGIRLGEAHRPAFVAKKYYKEGTGILNSKHKYSLAIDLWITTTGKNILWKDGAYGVLGEYWDSIGGIWGGNFRRRKDPYHFEFNEKPSRT